MFSYAYPYMVLLSQEKSIPRRKLRTDPEIATENAAGSNYAVIAQTPPETDSEITEIAEAALKEKDRESQFDKQEAVSDDFPDLFEISECETLKIRETSLCLEKTDSNALNVYEFKFDDYSYLQLLRCFRDFCFFAAAPNAMQFEAMMRFEKRGREVKLAKRDFETQSRTLNGILDFAVTAEVFKEHECFLLRQFLILNLPLLYAYMELDRLIGQ